MSNYTNSSDEDEFRGEEIQVNTEEINTQEENLLLNQPDEILAKYMKYIGYNSGLRLVDMRMKNIYDYTAPQKYKLIKICENKKILKLPPKWLYASQNFIPIKEVLKNLYFLHIDKRLSLEELAFVKQELKDMSKITYFKIILPDAYWDKIGGAFETFFTTLEQNKSLRSLNFKYSQLDTKGLNNIIRILENNPRLKSLTLEHCHINENMVEILSNFLRKNKTLLSLKLGSNPIHDRGAQSLTKALQNNSTLQTLKLGYIQIEDEGVLSLATALEKNSSLLTLDLNSNRINDKRLNIIGNSLERNTTLTSLNLSHNSIDDNNITEFSKYLSRSNLTSLNLENNRIGGSGARALIFSIVNTKITHIDLRYNPIGYEGGLGFIDKLGDTNLIELKLNSYNRLSRSEASSLEIMTNNIIKFN